jgi:hypothetical protein
MREVNTNRIDTKPYRTAFGRLLANNGMGDMEKKTRMDCFRCTENAATIEAWREQQTLDEQLRLNHPTVVWRRWQVSTRARDSIAAHASKAARPAQPTTVPTEAQKEIERLRREVERLKKEIDAAKAGARVYTTREADELRQALRDSNRTAAALKTENAELVKLGLQGDLRKRYRAFLARARGKDRRQVNWYNKHAEKRAEIAERTALSDKLLLDIIRCFHTDDSASKTLKDNTLIAVLDVKKRRDELKKKNLPIRRAWQNDQNYWS